MNPNKLTQGHNLIWESSRMMLPEHKELLQQHQKQLVKKTKPILDQQEIELIEEKIKDAISMRTLVHITLFHPYETVTLKGVIQTVDGSAKQLKLLTMADEIEWISLNDVVDIE